MADSWKREWMEVRQDFACEYCPLVCPTEDQLNGHLKQKHPERICMGATHACIIHGCDYVTNRKWNVWTHLKRKHQYPDNTINWLKKKDAEYRKRERMDAQRGYEFPCEICDLAYPNKKRLNEHIKRKHPERVEEVSPSQVVCAAPGCSFVCQTRELLAGHARHMHSTPECKYKVDTIIFPDEDEFREWKHELEKTTDSSFAVNSATPVKAAVKRVYMWCAKANKVRTSKPIPETERKRHGNYRGRSKRVQSHCTAFITAVYHPNGQVEVKFCSDHIGHNQTDYDGPLSPEMRGGKRELRSSVKRQRIDTAGNDGLESDEDSYIDVGGEEIDHEEYVEDEAVVEDGMYSDEEEDEDEKKPTIRFLTATDRMRPQHNPVNQSYPIEEEYEEEEEEPPQPSTSMRYMPQPPPHIQPPLQGHRLAYPRPVRPHMRTPDVKDETNMTMMLLRQSQQRVMRAGRTKEEREQIGRFNRHLQVALKQLDPPMRSQIRRGPMKNEAVNMEPEEELYDLDPEDVGQEEVVEEETVYEEEPSTSYGMHEYYDEGAIHH